MAVYIGFDTPKSLGEEETGASVAMPVFIDFMKEAIKDKPSVPFRMPNSVKLVKIDKSTGKYPNPSTPKEKIFFEALKIEDEIQENEIVDEDLNKEEVKDEKQLQGNPKDKPLESNLEDNQPTGIY
jgi:penicillin-binding protein 1A